MREPMQQAPHGVQIEVLENLADSHREDLSNLMDQQHIAEVHLDRVSEKVEKVRVQLQEILSVIKGLEA